MDTCKTCQNCGGCPGCRGSLELTPGEVEMLNKLGQIPFLPVARRAGDEEPVYLEDDLRPPEEYSLILKLLERKGLVSLDFDRPLARFDYSAYAGFPLRGSVALTARGQGVVELLETQGIT